MLIVNKNHTQIHHSKVKQASEKLISNFCLRLGKGMIMNNFTEEEFVKKKKNICLRTPKKS